jgi:hypothetical protein
MRERFVLSSGVNLALGGWLFLSAFLWPHSDVERLNAVIAGGLAAIFALLSTRARVAHYLSAAVGAWVFWSAWFFAPRYLATSYNALAVGVVMFCFAIIPDFMEHAGRSRSR